MKICVVSSLFPPEYIGGAEVIAENYSKLLAARGHAITIVNAAKQDKSPTWTILDEGRRMCSLPVARAYAGSAHERIGFGRKLRWHYQEAFSSHLHPDTVEEMRSIFDASDIVNVHLFTGFGTALLGILPPGKRIIFTLHDYALLDTRSNLYLFGRPQRVLWPHQRMLVRWRRRYLCGLRRAEFLAPSAYLLDVVKSWLDLDVPCTVARNPVAVSLPGPPKGSVVCSRVRFLYLGKVIPEKGVDILVEIFLSSEVLKDRAELIIAGEGRLLSSLVEKCRRAPNVRLIGRVERSGLGALLMEADCLLVPSRWPENSPTVVYEAAIAGMGIVGADIGGLGELTRVVGGIVVPPGLVEAWKRAVESLVMRPERLRSLKGNVKKGANEISYGNCADKIAAVFNKV